MLSKHPSTHIEGGSGHSSSDSVLVSEMSQHRLERWPVVQVVDQHVQTGHDAHDVPAELWSFEVIDVETIEEGLGRRCLLEQAGNGEEITIRIIYCHGVNYVFLGRS